MNSLKTGERVQQELTTPDGIKLQCIHDQQHGRDSYYWRTEIPAKHAGVLSARVSELITKNIGYQNRPGGFHGAPVEGQSDVNYKIGFVVDVNNGKLTIPIHVDFTNEPIRIRNDNGSAGGVYGTLSRALVETTALLIREDAKAGFPPISH